ncbi:cupin domain-containing protein [Cellulomonas sp. URHD0024]|uniref:cupin domain-containing protein n=1 Tax=Cellulomonas sp. URHD0024 TaxID=1302620 RepID=UPI0012DC4472|nr:cupin domain-containing protein [Cellulomonas sp. URHD0024]
MGDDGTNPSMTGGEPRVYPAREVPKPWGSELVFAEVDGVYVGKVLRVRAGESLSLQLHTEKTETVCVISGEADVDYGGDTSCLETARLRSGDTLHLPAGAVHRITAVEELVFAEVSTAHVGWRTDIVRLDDRYGRSGTSAP